MMVVYDFARTSYGVSTIATCSHVLKTFKATVRCGVLVQLEIHLIVLLLHILERLRWTVRLDTAPTQVFGSGGARALAHRAPHRKL